MADLIQDVLVRFDSETSDLVGGLKKAGAETDRLRDKNKSLFQSYKDFSAVGRDIFGTIEKAVRIGQQGLKAYEDQLRRTGGSAVELSRIRDINNQMSKSWNDLSASVGKLVVELGPALSAISRLITATAEGISFLAKDLGTAVATIERITNLDFSASDIARIFVFLNPAAGAARFGLGGGGGAEQGLSAFESVSGQWNAVIRQVNAQTEALRRASVARTKAATELRTATGAVRRAPGGPSRADRDLLSNVGTSAGGPLGEGLDAPEFLTAEQIGFGTRALGGGPSFFEPNDLVARADATREWRNAVLELGDAWSAMRVVGLDAFDALKVGADAFSQSLGDAIKNVVDGNLSLGNAARKLASDTLIAISNEMFARGTLSAATAIIDVSGRHAAAAAAFFAGGAAIRALANQVGPSSAASASGAGPSRTGSGGGGGAVPGGGGRTVNIVLTSSFGQESDRVRNQRLLRAVREADSQSVSGDVVRFG